LTTGQLQEGIWFDDLPQTTILFDEATRLSADKSTGPLTKFEIPPLTVLTNPKQVYLQRAYEVLNQVKAFSSGARKERRKI